jgi:hypothetical protein
LLFPGVQLVGSQGLLNGLGDVNGVELILAVRLQPGKVQHIVHQPREPVGFVVGCFQEFLALSVAQVFAKFVQGFDEGLDVKQRGPQFVGHVADELGFGFIEGNLTGNVLDRDGDPFNVFSEPGPAPCSAESAGCDC